MIKGKDERCKWCEFRSLELFANKWECDLDEEDMCRNVREAKQNGEEVE